MSHLLSGLAPRIVMSITIGKVPDPWKFTPEVKEMIMSITIEKVPEPWKFTPEVEK